MDYILSYMPKSYTEKIPQKVVDKVNANGDGLIGSFLLIEKEMVV